MKLTDFALAWVLARAGQNDDHLKHTDALGAWKDLFPDAPVPWLLEYANDDGGKLPHSLEILAAISSYPQTVEAWNALAEIHDPCQQTYGRCLGLVGEGRTILRYLRTILPEQKEPEPGPLHVQESEMEIPWASINETAPTSIPAGASKEPGK